MVKKIELPDGYKQTEVGIIPIDWEAKQMDLISTSIASGTSKTKTTYGEFPIYGSTGIIGFNFTYDYKGQRVLIARVGANAGTVNHVDGKYSVSDNTLMVELKRDVEFAFIYFYLKYYNLNKLIFGSGQPLITGSQLKRLFIPLPPTKEEQIAIATALSDTDALIENLEKFIAKKRNIKQGAMQELLNPKEGWLVKQLGDYVKITSGESPSKYRFQTSGVPYFKVEQLNNSEKYQIETPYYIETDNIVPKGSIIFPKRGASILLNKVRILVKDSFMDTNLMTLTLTEELNGEFVYYLLTYIQLWRIADTTSIPQINNKHINPIKISIPRLEEQIRIAIILSDMDAEIEAFEEKLHKYRMIKKGMMQVLLTGKIRLI